MGLWANAKAETWGDLSMAGSSKEFLPPLPCLKTEKNPARKKVQLRIRPVTDAL